MEAEAQPSVVDGSEVKDEVKGEEVTDDEAVTIEQRVSGDGDGKTGEDAGVSEDQSTLQGGQGAGDSRPNEETEINAEQAERGVDGNEREGERDDANDEGETEVKSEDKLEQGEANIADELRRSRKAEDEGDEVVSSKVTTVSFASEVQVLNEDELEEQWTTTGGDDDGVDADMGDDDTGGIIESDENKTEVVRSSAHVASAEDGHRSEEEVSAAQDSNELESIPAASPEAGEQKQSDLDPAENAAPMEEAVAEEVDIHVHVVTTEQGQAVEEEQPLPETAPSGGAGVVTAEQNPEAKQGQEDGDEIFDDIPVIQAMEETQKETVQEYEEVVHRNTQSCARQITLEATAEYNPVQVIAMVEVTEEGEGTETLENDPVLQSEEVEAENAFVEAEAEVHRSLLAGAPEDVVEATVMEEATSQEHHESGSQEAEDSVLGVEVHVDGDGDQQEKLDDREDGAVDSRTELQTDDALQDENTNFEENQDEHYNRDLTYPSDSIPYETDPNLSSVNLEEDPTAGNFSEYQQQPILASDFDPLPPIEPEMVRQDILQLQEERRIEGLSPIELLTQANQAHGILPSPLRSPHHQQHPRSGSNSKLESMSRATSLSMVQIARIPSPPAHVKAQMMIDEERRASTRMSSRLPPSVMKMSSVMVNARKKAVKNRDASVYYEEKQFHKTIGLDEAINSRPPMPFDLDTPGPCLYSPRNKPLYEDNAPEYSFGMKFPERAGGGRTAYSKTWFNSNDNYTVKTRFERRWPSPNAYGKGRSMVGRKVPDKKDYPSFSMRGKTNFIMSKRGDGKLSLPRRSECIRYLSSASLRKDSYIQIASEVIVCPITFTNGSENEPGPDQYHRQRSDPLLFRRAPAFSMGAKLDRGRLFGAPEITPAPNYYNPHTNYTSRKVTYPAFTISGIRKPKSHALGPHATL